jgi:pimeloyl-ACP methyl ester carboxylesterase
MAMLATPDHESIRHDRFPCIFPSPAHLIRRAGEGEEERQRRVFTVTVIMGPILCMRLLAAAAVCLAAWPTLKTTGTALTPTGSLAYSLAGSGSPAVVLQSGLGDGKNVWQPVYAQIARTTTVMAFDRPGYGGSGAASGSRSPCIIASEQRALLRAVGLHPPYVLVGHSLGGLYQFVYAKLYPEDVAGLVLLDPTHPRLWEQMQKQAKTTAAIVARMRWTFSRVMQREFHDQSTCLDRLDMNRPLHRPVRILVRTRFDFFDRLQHGALERMACGLEKDWLRLTGAARVERVSGAGHYLQRDRPEQVVQAVRAMVIEASPRANIGREANGSTDALGEFRRGSPVRRGSQE